MTRTRMLAMLANAAVACADMSSLFSVLGEPRRLNWGGEEARDVRSRQLLRKANLRNGVSVQSFPPVYCTYHFQNKEEVNSPALLSCVVGKRSVGQPLSSRLFPVLRVKAQQKGGAHWQRHKHVSTSVHSQSFHRVDALARQPGSRPAIPEACLSSTYEGGLSEGRSSTLPCILPRHPSY